MLLLLAANGSGPGDEEGLFCCGVFPILPLVVVLVAVAVSRNSARAAGLALLLAGLPCAVLVKMVTGYRWSDNGDVRADQETGWRAVWFYALMVGLAGASALWVVASRWVRQRRKPVKPAGQPPEEHLSCSPD
jgi:hypothetical protein